MELLHHLSLSFGTIYCFNSNCNVVVEKADYLKTNKNIFGINNLDTKLSKPCS